jgi:hypothetical protein
MCTRGMAFENGDSMSGKYLTALGAMAPIVSVWLVGDVYISLAFALVGAAAFALTDYEDTLIVCACLAILWVALCVLAAISPIVRNL